MKYLANYMALIGLLLSMQSMAATFHVQKYGDDLNTCGQNDPCLTIQNAINQTAVGDRVLVGPGIYQENLLITQNDIRVVSLSGADATVIEAVNDTVPTIDITADNVVLGRQEKGFTILQENAFAGSNINIIGNNSTVVGNSLTLTESSTTTLASRYIVNISGSGSTLRHNQILLNNIEEFGIGMSPDGFPSSLSDGVEHVVTNNYIRCTATSYGGGIGLFIFNGENSNTRVVNNRFENCGNLPTTTSVFDPFTPSISILNLKNDFSGLSINSGDVYRENVFINTNSAIGLFGGNPSVIDNLMQNDNPQGIGVFLVNTSEARVRGNLIVNTDIAINLTTDISTTTPNQNDIVRNTIFDSNTAVDISNAGTTHDDAIDRFALNNIINSACPLVLGQVLATTVNLNNNYWGNTTGPDFSCDSNAQTSFVGGSLTTNPALIANPIEYQPSQ